MSGELPEIMRRAMTDTVVNIGQLSTTEKRTLDKYVKRGWLSKGVGGPFPKEKTVYAFPGYDFDGHRQAYVDHMIRLSELDRKVTEQRTSNPAPRERGGGQDE